MPPWPPRPRGPSRAMTRMPRGPHDEKRRADVIGAGSRENSDLKACSIPRSAVPQSHTRPGQELFDRHTHTQAAGALPPLQ